MIAVLLVYTGLQTAEAGVKAGKAETCLVEDGPHVANRDNPRDDCQHRIHRHPEQECWKIFGWKWHCRTVMSGWHQHCNGG